MMSKPDFNNIVYISHPFNNDPKNYRKVTDIVAELQNQHPGWMILSPIHAFSMIYDKMPYLNGILRCFWLLDKADEMLVYGDYKQSKGCLAEIDFCKQNNIPYKIMEEC